MPAPKLKSLKSLKNKAWKLFSIFVRQLGMDDQGFNHCYTCGRRIHWSEANAGHYRHDSHDYDEMNVKVQCPGCNLYESGRSDNFYLHLVKDYGQEIADELRTRAKWNGYSRGQLMEIIKKYNRISTE